MEDYPVYYISIDDEFADGELTFISIVENPAIEIKGFAFSVADAKDLFEFKFNTEKQILAGPGMIPDIKIKRVDPELGKYYVVFSKETIEKLVAKFNKTPKEFKVNVDHSTVVPSAYIFSNWIISNSKNDKSNSYGFELPEGTWFCEVKVDDSEFWNTEVKENGKSGFSVEGLFGLKMSKQKFEMEKIKFESHKTSTGEEIFLVGDIAIDAEVYNNRPSYQLIDGKKSEVRYPIWEPVIELEDGRILLLADSKIVEIKEKEITTEVTEEIVTEELKKEEKMSKTKLKFAEAVLEDGTKIYYETLEVGAEVWVLDEDLVKVPVFDGEHKLEDGTIVATVDGKVTEVKTQEEMAEVISLDEAAVMAILQPKLDELYAIIAELKNGIEQKEVKEVVVDEVFTSEKFSANPALSNFLAFKNKKK
jgi:hypothetical protein